MSSISERYNQAEKLKDEGNHQQAIELLKGILQDEPEHVLSHLALGRLYTHTGEHELAVQHGERACQLEPDDAFNFTAMSVTYQRAYAGTNDHKYIRMAEDAMAKAHQLNNS
jgi:cytochrome c-type biogenesis protein CcmH/NrfG